MFKKYMHIQKLGNREVLSITIDYRLLLRLVQQKVKETLTEVF